MIHVFYFLSILAILWEVMNLTSTLRMKNKTDAIRGKKYEELTYSQRNASILMALYIIWNIFGFLTLNWPAFILLFLLGIIPKNNVIVRFLDSLLSLSILIFILINAYHFRIDIYDLIFK